MYKRKDVKSPFRDHLNVDGDYLDGTVAQQEQLDAALKYAMQDREDELFEQTLKEIEEYNARVRETYESKLAHYKEIAREYLDRADECTIDETFNPDRYSHLEHVGYARVAQSPKNGDYGDCIVLTEMTDGNTEIDFPRRFSPQDFLVEGNPKELICQWSDFEDDFRGYRLFPMPGSDDEYWVVYFEC